MRSKPLVILLLLAVVMVALAVMTGKPKQNATPSEIGKLLLPELAVNDVARLTLVNQGDTVTVVRADAVWTVTEKQGYPANFDRVRSALLKLSELKIADRRHATADSRATYGVMEPAPAQPDATRIVLANVGGQALATVHLGKHHLRKTTGDNTMGGDYPDGRYVSVDGGKTVYLVRDPLTDFTAQAMGWLVPDLLNVEAGDLARLSITGPDREPLELKKGDAQDAALELVNLAGDEETDMSNLSSLRNALAYLNLQDVADPSLQDAAMGFEAPLRFEAETSDGCAYTLLVGAKTEGDGRYLRVKAAFKEPPLPVPSVDATGVTNTPPAPDTVAARAAVDLVNQKLAPWTFVIPSYKADALTLTRDQLAKPKPAAEPEAKADAAVPPVTPDAPVEPPATAPVPSAPASEPPPEPSANADTNAAAAEQTGAATP